MVAAAVEVCTTVSTAASTAPLSPERTSKGDSAANTLLASLPTPSRSAREEQSVASSVDLLSICPWDSLAQFLTLPELEWFCCASATLHAEHTIEDPNASADDEEEAPKKAAKRKLLAPLLLLKIETAEAELQRVSLPNVRAIRVWNHHCLDYLRDALETAGGPQVLRSLEKIALKGCPLESDVISEFIYPAFSHTQLRHLNLEKNQVSDDILCELVKSGALDVGSLESMNLRFNMISSRGIKALAASPCCRSLKWVNLKMNRVGDEGAIALAEMLEGNSSMSLLNLRRQMPPLTNKAAVAFGEMLKYNNTLEQLRLRQNKIGDEGAEALAAEFADHVRRVHMHRGVGAKFELDLERNLIKEGGAKALLKSLDGVTRAVKVEVLLHGNPVSTDKKGNPVQPDILVDADAGTGSSAVPLDDRLRFDTKAEEIL